MFVEKINAAGGVNGRKIELIVKDTGGSPEKAVSLAKQLIEEEKVLAIIGPSTSGETMADQEPLPGEQDDPGLLRRRGDHRQSRGQLRLQDPPEGQPGRRWIFKTMKDMGITKIGVITSNDGFGKAGKDQLEKLAPANGIDDRRSTRSTTRRPPT